ncbi:hypothetical protein ABZW11_21355 [Nonomuraea sp. NPDC004580]|uniref:hypothetical protein n=1 Tax=Nonomuraea sp. NPDC004580 TaxID=3154552 RepID=UPI0033B94F94
MTEVRRIAVCVAILIASGALAGVGVFLYDHTLQSADQIASVGGFIVGVVGMVGAAIGAWTSRRSAPESTATSPSQEPARPSVTMIGCGMVINGDNNIIDASQGGRKAKKRRPGPKGVGPGGVRGGR